MWNHSANPPNTRQNKVITRRRPWANNPLLTLRASEGAELEANLREIMLTERNFEPQITQSDRLFLFAREALSQGG